MVAQNRVVAEPYVLGWVHFEGEGGGIVGRFDGPPDSVVAELRGGVMVEVTKNAREPVPGRACDWRPPVSADAWVAGVALTPFSSGDGAAEPVLASAAARRALADADIDPGEVQAVFVGNVTGGPGVGQRALMGTPLVGLPIVNVENACASSSTALMEAVAWIKAGMADVALVLGVEVLTGRTLGATPFPDDPLGSQGLTLPALYALKARHHMETHGTTAEHFARVAVKNRAHGAQNPLALVRREVSVEEVLGSRSIADPLTLLQCCRDADGAAAAVVVSAARARGQRRAVRLAASALASGRRRVEIGWNEETTAAVAERAYGQAGIGPDDVDVAEVHDAFTPGELLAYERLGFCTAADAGPHLADGRFWIGGKGPVVNPSGGLLARGHPFGATGLAQVHEVVTQLRGEAGDRQTEGARVGLTLTLGGSVPSLETNACVVHILRAG